MAVATQRVQLPGASTLARPLPSFSVRKRCIRIQCRQSKPQKQPMQQHYTLEEYQAETPEQRKELDRKNLRYLWDRGWAPWEEIHSPENEFALVSLGPRSRNPLLPKEAEKLLSPRPPTDDLATTEEESQELEESEEAAEEDEDLANAIVYALVPPRDWPPPGWKVNEDELAFIKETHTMYLDGDVTVEQLQEAATADAEPSLERWETFLKQYDTWVAANRERLDKEALEADPDYEPGRRRTGKHRFEDDLYELPFIYPGQYYRGVVTHVDLYDGAFVYIGAVHDGWVSIQDNDWYKLRHIIKVGTEVTVEVLAKRDPYRYRFPIECRFVDPNIDDYIFRRTKYPPIICRPGDKNLHEVARETGRDYLVEMTPSYEFDEDPRNFEHPYSHKVRILWNAEEIILNEEENGGHNSPFMHLTAEQVVKYINRGQDLEVPDEDDDNEDDEDKGEDEEIETCLLKVLEPTEEVPHASYLLQVNPEELELDAARAERQALKEIEEQGNGGDQTVERPPVRRMLMIGSLNAMHRRRVWEEQEALLRDITCRVEAGLPISDERYSDDPWPPNRYNPKKKVWQADYKGDRKRLKYAKYYRDVKRSRRSPKKGAPSA